MSRAVRLAIGALTLSLLSQACTTQDQDPAARGGPRGPLVATDCPDDVSSAVIAQVECASLTVPESPDNPDRLITVFVTTVHGPEGAEGREPIVVPSLANQPNYGGIAPLAQRVGRDVIIVDTRGTAHSTPRLECPEVTATAPEVWAAPTADPGGRARLLDAVSTCHQRWTAAGVDLASYDLIRAAADLEVLRKVLGIERWNVVAYGDASRVAFELLRAAPAPIRSLVLDSPEVPGTDPRAVAGPATQRAVRRVLDSCASDTRCRAEHPGARGLLSRAMAAVAHRPVRLTVDLDGARVPVLLDAGFVARSLRQLMSDGGSSGALFRLLSIPGFLETVADRRRGPLARAVGRLVQFEGPLCLGFRTPCLPAHHASTGVDLTVLCRDIAPFTEPDAPRLGPGFRPAYGASPWWDVCDVWPVDRAPPEVADPPQSEIPTLVVLGRYAPYSPESTVRPALAGLGGASYVVDPAAAHNVLPRPCGAEARNTWIEDLQPFAVNPCSEEEGIPWDD